MASDLSRGDSVTATIAGVIEDRYEDQGTGKPRLVIAFQAGGRRRLLDIPEEAEDVTVEPREI